MANQTTIDALQVLQNKSIRIIAGLNSRTSVDNFYKTLNIIPLHQMVKLVQAGFMYEFSKNLLPQNYCENWVQNRHYRADRNLRNDRNLHIIRTSLSSLLKHPLISFPKLWNNIPMSIRDSRSKNIFKARFLDHLNK